MKANTAKKTTVKGVKKASAAASKPDKPKTGAGSGLEKAIIVMSPNIDRIGQNIDLIGENIYRMGMGENIDLTSKNIDHIGMSEDIKKSFAAMNAVMAASKAETDAKIAASNARLAESFARLDRVVEGTKAELAGLSESAGRAVESMTRSFFDARMTYAGVTFDEIECGIHRKKKLPDGKKMRGEYDIVMYNGTSIALIEAKNRVRMEDLDKLIEEQLPRFKLFFPQYKDFKYYLGLCGMSFEDGVEETALERGIGTLKLSGNAVEINETNVKAW